MKEKNLKKMEKYPVFCSDSYTMLEKMDLFKSTFQTNTKMKKKNEIKSWKQLFCCILNVIVVFTPKLNNMRKLKL